MTMIQTVLEREKTPVYLIHLVPPLLALFFGIGHLIAAAVVWLITRETSRTVDQQGKNALNFQLSMFIYYSVVFLLGLILGVFTFGFGFIVVIPFWLLFFTVGFCLQILLMILALIATNNGQTYHYPLSIPFLR